MEATSATCRLLMADRPKDRPAAASSSASVVRVVFQRLLDRAVSDPSSALRLNFLNEIDSRFDRLLFRAPGITNCTVWS